MWFCFRLMRRRVILESIEWLLLYIIFVPSVFFPFRPICAEPSIWAKGMEKKSIEQWCDAYCLFQYIIKKKSKRDPWHSLAPYFIFHALAVCCAHDFFLLRLLYERVLCKLIYDRRTAVFDFDFYTMQNNYSIEFFFILKSSIAF